MKIIIWAFFALMIATGIAMAQGNTQVYNTGAVKDGFTPASITKYSNAAGSTKILIPIAKTVSKICIQPTVATGVRLGTTGDQKAIAANAEWCRGVAKGVTQLQYSSSVSGTVIVERQF